MLSREMEKLWETGGGWPGKASLGKSHSSRDVKRGEAGGCADLGRRASRCVWAGGGVHLGKSPEARVRRGPEAASELEEGGRGVKREDRTRSFGFYCE